MQVAKIYSGILIKSLLLIIFLYFTNFAFADTIQKTNYFLRLSVIQSRGLIPGIPASNPSSSMFDSEVTDRKLLSPAIGLRVSRNYFKNRVTVLSSVQLLHKRNNNGFSYLAPDTYYSEVVKSQQIAIQPQFSIRYNFKHIRPAFGIITNHNLWTKNTGATFIAHSSDIIDDANKLTNPKGIDFAVIFELYFPIKYNYGIVLSATSHNKKDFLGRRRSFHNTDYLALSFEIKI